MTASCYSAKCFPAHWKANVMLIISGGVTDACTQTHNCSYKGTRSEGWKELLICHKRLWNTEWRSLGKNQDDSKHADIPFERVQGKWGKKSERAPWKIMRKSQLCQGCSFTFRPMTVSTKPEILSIECESTYDGNIKIHRNNWGWGGENLKRAVCWH